MRPDELGALLAGVAVIEGRLEYITETVNLMKLINATRHQFVGYGHFKSVFETTAPVILSRVMELFDLICRSFPTVSATLRDICSSYGVGPDSPLGLAIRRYMLDFETYRMHSIPSLISSFKNWVNACELNSLPLVLSLDVIFAKHNPELILSPLPSYSTDVPVPGPADLEGMTGGTHQELLYRALYHARQRKTTLATEEMRQCCLKLTEDADKSCLARSSIALAQVFDLLGMKEEALLALNESVSGAKGLDDTSVLASAVALKAHIDTSPSAWKFAAAVANPHPLAAIRVAFDKGDLPAALLVHPFLACEVFGTKTWEIAKLAPLTEQGLPIRVLAHARACEWDLAARLIRQLDIGRIEVRASALALAVAVFSVNGRRETAAIYREDLADVLAIELGHFSEVKPTIRAIAEVYEGEIPGVEHVPLEQPLIDRLKWMCVHAQSRETLIGAGRLCASCGASELRAMLLQRCADLDVPECRSIGTDSLDVEDVMTTLAK